MTQNPAVSMPERFALQHAPMVQEPELAVLGSFFNIIDRDGAIIRLYDNLPLIPAAAMRFVKHRCPVYLKATDLGEGK